MLTQPNFIFSHLNSHTRTYIDAEPEQELLIVLPLDAGQKISEEEKYRITYLSKILEIMQTFNVEGYPHYDGTQCVKYNPFKKVERLIGDFYELYNDDSQHFESEKIKIQTIVTKLTGQAPYNKNLLVTIYRWKAVDVFEPFNFTKISSFCSESKIDNKNILKLCNDFEATLNDHRTTLNLIYEAVST